jgi:signal transduction histidine kinase
MILLLGVLSLLFVLPTHPDLSKARAIYDSTEVALANRGDYKKAEALLNQAQKSSLDTDVKMMLTFGLRGQIEGYRSNYFNSDFYLFEALKYAEKLNAEYFISEISHSLAINKRQEGDLNGAAAYYDKAIVNAEKDQKSPRLALMYNNYGLVYLHKASLDSAEMMFRKSYDLSKDAGYRSGEGYFFSNMGSIRLKQKKYQEALSFFEKGMEVFSGVNGPQALLKKEMAECYFALGQMKEAEQTIAEAIEGIKHFENKKELRDCYQLKLNIYEATGRANATAPILKDLLQVEQEIAKQDQDVRLKSAEYGYLLNLQEEQNRSQRLEIEVQKQRNLALVLGGALVTVLTIVFIILFLYTRSKSITIRRQAEELDKFNQILEVRIAERTAELSKANTALALKNKEISQALLEGKLLERKRLANDLHDNLGGLIAAVKWSFAAFNPQSDKEKEILEKIEGMLGDAYSSVRYLSHNLLPKDLEEQGLVVSLERFIDRLNDNPRILFTFKSALNQRLNPDAEFELYGALMELLTNITKYCDGDRVELSITEVPDRVEVHLIDNGNEIKMEGQGLGSSSVRERIETRLMGSLAYRYGEGHNYIKITIPHTAS